MATLAFNPLDATKRLREAGFDEKQADTMMRALLESQERLVTTEHFDARLETLQVSTNAKIDILEARMNGEFMTVKWMMGILISGVIALVLKAFFLH